MPGKEKVFEDKTVGQVIVRKSSRSRLVSIRVDPVRGIVVTVPSWASYDTGIAFLVQKRDWVLRKWLEMQARLASDQAPMPEEEDIESMRRKAKATLPARLSELAEKYGFSYNKVTIKNNTSNWGSCSARRNINLNLRLVAVSPEERDYILLHELCQLRHMNHGPEFHALLDSLCRAETGIPEAELQRRIRRHILR